MKTNLFIFAAFVAAFLSVANYAAAQVTIGGSDLPKAGTILDLNPQNGVKGGLALSNVSITDLEKIPAGQLVGITDEQDVNIDLTGMLVYNTNTDFCLGVYVWDGNKWLKAGKDYQVKAAGSGELNIPSLIENENVIPVDDDVTLKFTAPEGVQFYNWYEDNTYLATTTTPEYTSNFPVGSHTMKVVLDNCLSLSESNITFNARNVYPTSLPAATGGLIHILSAGAFPHATTDEYVQDGLVVHYDGIDNQNLGDTNHSSDAVVWKDLSDNGYDVTLRVGHSGTSRGDATNAASVAECANSAWEDNGFLLGGYCYFAKVPADPTAANALSDIMPNLPFDNDNYTIESVFNMSKLTSPRGGFVGWGKQSTVNESNSLGFLWANNSINPTTPSFRHFWWTNDIDVRFTDANANSIKNIAITYDNDASASPNNRIFYYNGTTTSIEYIGNHCDDPLTYNCRNKTNKNTARCGSFYIGLAVANNTNDECVPAANGAVHYSRGNKIFSIRIYNKTLSSDEILANYKVDKLRFAATPIVKIGPKQCTNVVVHSDRLITCQAPAGTSGTTVNVEVISAEDSSRILLLENEFKYQ